MTQIFINARHEKKIGFADVASTGIWILRLCSLCTVHPAVQKPTPTP